MVTFVFIMTRNRTICLNMIVKDESAVIRRALQSLKSIIDYWVIVDTGSNDGTQEIIKECLKDIPGELHERPWKNFAHNRNEALKLARSKADYIYFADADELAIIQKPVDKKKLNRDYYCVMLKGFGIQYYRILMVNNHPGWEWRGEIHEYITNDSKVVGEILHQITIDVSLTDGRRSQDPEKCRRDAKTLEEALKNDPENSRNVFYLAQLYRIIGEKELALRYYEKRISMPGLEEEIFWSHYSIGCIELELERTCESFIARFSRAYEMNPARAEPLYRLAYYFNSRGMHLLAYWLAKWAMNIPIPQFYAAIEKPIYEYGVLLEYAQSAYYLGKYDEACKFYDKLLQLPDLLPADIRNFIVQNLTRAKKQSARY